MELDTTTFILEIFNFLVLLWLLNRFLFRPAKVALTVRSEKEAAAAKAMADERHALDEKTAQLDASLADTAAHQQEMLAQTERDAAALRQKAQDDLSLALNAERQKARQALEMELERARMTASQAARRQAAEYVADYLRRLATPALEASIVNLFIQDLRAASLPWEPSDQASLADSTAGEVLTAFTPSAELRARVEAIVSERLGAGLRLTWEVDASVVCGIRLHLPGHQLECSLARGLESFRAAGVQEAE